MRFSWQVRQHLVLVLVVVGVVVVLLRGTSDPRYEKRPSFLKPFTEKKIGRCCNWFG